MPQIKNCKFVYKCPLEWDDLKVTADVDVRFCEKCEHSVYLCRNNEELQEATRKKQCVAVNRDEDGNFLSLGMMAPVFDELDDIAKK